VHEHNENPEQPSAKPWVFPRELTGGPDEHANDEDDVAWTVLCTVADGDADEIGALLESEGLPAHAEPSKEVVAAEESSEAVARFADIHVHADHLDAARGMLARPREHMLAEAEADRIEHAKSRRERDVANWVCPECRKALRRLPLSPAWQKVRLLCFVLVVGPVVFMLLPTLPIDSVERFVKSPPIVAVIAWFMLLAMLALLMTGGVSDKYCPTCGWNERDAGEDAAPSR
jgi:hypothetical protein